MIYAGCKTLLSAIGVALFLIIAGNAHAASDQIFHLSIVNQTFQPNALTIPAGQRVKIMVVNKDSIPAEFESNDFHAEVVIPGKTELPVYVRPLEPGIYHFFNDFHPQSKDTLIVKKTSQ